MKRTALLISFLFHPLVMLNAGVAIILFVHPYYTAKYYDSQVYTLMGFIVLHTVFFPLLGMLLLKIFRVIESFHLSDRRQRTIPFTMTTAFFAVTCFNLYNNEITGLPFAFILACTISLALNLVINLFFKISAHAVAAAGLCGLLCACLFAGGYSELLWLTTLSFVAAGLAGSARLLLAEHSHRDVYWGYLVGFVTVFLTTIVYGI